ncbi:MAG: dihydropteroate synthase [Planctomycetales bacterium]|nr:dihydropteroate synthase [Planctomycetales bacterium]
MGIINVTPDSFSDGGRFRLAELAVEHALRLADEGAGVLDIGGESTRPYAALVDEQEELRRVIPVIRALAKQTDRPLSIDTSKASVAEQALDAGAEIINDVTGLAGDPRMLDVARRSGAGICVMHMQGTPRDMQDNPVYANVVTDIHDYLRQRRDTLLASGIEPAKICLDPGIGFGKTHDHNLTLLGACRRFHELGQPLLVGHSRKGFIGHLIGDREADRMAGTIGVTLALVEQGVQVIRVHDIAPARDAIRLFRACRGQPTVFPGDPLPG